MKINYFLSTAIFCSACAVISTPTMADDISEQITAGLEAYNDKDYKIALEELQFATAQIQQLNQKEMLKLLPKALDGWTEEEAEGDNQLAMSMMGGGTTIQKEFSRDNESVKVMVMANSPMLPMMTMMMKNPALMASQKGVKPYRYKRAKGMIKKENRKTEINLLVAGQILVQISGSDLKDDTVLEEYLKQMDLKKLKNALL